VIDVIDEILEQSLPALLGPEQSWRAAHVQYDGIYMTLWPTVPLLSALLPPYFPMWARSPSSSQGWAAKSRTAVHRGGIDSKQEALA
jgi:hypothetical protein